MLLLKSIANRIFIYGLFIICIILAFKLWLANNQNDVLSKENIRYKDNIILIKKINTKRVKIKDKEIKRLAGRNVRTLVKTIIQSDTVIIPIEIPISESYSGETEAFFWKLTKKKLTFKLKPIEIIVTESEKGWLFATQSGFFITGEVNALPDKKSGVWCHFDSEGGVGLTLTINKMLFGVNYNLLKQKIRLSLGYNLFFF